MEPIIPYTKHVGTIRDIKSFSDSLDNTKQRVQNDATTVLKLPDIISAVIN